MLTLNEDKHIPAAPMSIKRISLLTLSGLFFLGLLMSCSSQHSRQLPIMGNCDQARNTAQAPSAILNDVNPLKFSTENIKAGKNLYQKKVKPVACASCHGKDGDGLGPMANMFNPQPRNFTCVENMNHIKDGQLFWIIKNGSPGTSMPAFNTLEDKEIWQLVSYLRDLAQ